MERGEYGSRFDEAGPNGGNDAVEETETRSTYATQRATMCLTAPRYRSPSVG